MATVVALHAVEDAIRHDLPSTLPPTRVSSLPSSRHHVTPPTSRASTVELRPFIPPIPRETQRSHRCARLAPRFREAGAFLFSVVRGTLAFILLCLACVPSFIFHYVVLLAVWRLDSFTRPLSNLVGLVSAALNAGPNNVTTADTHVRVAWRLYSRSILRDLEVSTAVCGTVLTLTIGLLTITNLADEVVTQTLAYLCIFACTAGFATALNMRRHLNNVIQLATAPFDWVELAERYQRSRFATVPMLLAGPTAWSTWSTAFFLSLLLAYVLRFRQSSIALTVLHGNPTLPMLLFTATTRDEANTGSDPSVKSAYFTWASRVVLVVEFITALTYFIHNAYYFTKLGIPLAQAEDLELANAQPNTAVPGITDNVAPPPSSGNVEPQPAAVDDPVAAVVPDNSDAATLDEISQESGATDDPEHEGGDRVLIFSL